MKCSDIFVNTALVNLDHDQGSVKRNYYLYAEDGFLPMGISTEQNTSIDKRALPLSGVCVLFLLAVIMIGFRFRRRGFGG